MVPVNMMWTLINFCCNRHDTQGQSDIGNHSIALASRANHEHAPPIALALSIWKRACGWEKVSRGMEL